MFQNKTQRKSGSGALGTPDRPPVKSQLSKNSDEQRSDADEKLDPIIERELGQDSNDYINPNNVLCPIFDISGTNLKEIPRSTDNSSEEVKKPMRPEKLSYLRQW